MEENPKIMACSFGFPKEVSDQLLRSLEQAYSSAISKVVREEIQNNFKKEESVVHQDTIDQLNQRIRQLEDDNKRLTSVVLSLTQN